MVRSAPFSLPNKIETLRIERASNMQRTVNRPSIRNCTCPLCNRTEVSTFPLPSFRPTWIETLVLVFRCLKYMMPQFSYYNCTETIYPFIDSHWNLLCGSKRQTDCWKKTVLDTLCHQQYMFENGESEIGARGYWRLADDYESPMETRGLSDSSAAVSPITLVPFDPQISTCGGDQRGDKLEPRCAQMTTVSPDAPVGYSRSYTPPKEMESPSVPMFRQRSNTLADIPFAFLPPKKRYL